MMDTVSIIALIGITVTLFGYIVFHRLALKREKKSRFANACNDFRKGISESISHVPAANMHWDNEILESMPKIISDIELAVKQF